MEGNPRSYGVWAPCLSYDNGLFYLVFTDVKSRLGAFKDTDDDFDYFSYTGSQN